MSEKRAFRRIIPAYAGSTAAVTESETVNPDHPRIRGEHFAIFIQLVDDFGSSPHTRGAPTSMPCAPPTSWIIPAYAGSTPPSRPLAARVADHPRIRGEHIPWGDSDGQHPGSSPHTRGALEVHARAGHRFGIIPAYAGSTGFSPSTSGAGADHPRIRGEHLRVHLIRDGNDRIIPAYAGSTCLSGRFSPPFADHPRIRGEHVHIEAPRCPQMGSSPHTRGARGTGVSGAHDCRIIPAYAGSTRCHVRQRRVLKDHPRIRGEHPMGARVLPRKSGSSPHTRGAHRHGFPNVSPGRIIPAYAGSTVGEAINEPIWADHPRIRGEHRQWHPQQPVDRGSSPHTRGAPERAGGPPAAQGIIPAYAGSTGWISPGRRRCKDHPRIRGEHQALTRIRCRNSGSSPHTRGAHSPSPVGDGSSRIIPAYAGSTCSPGRRGPRGADHPRIRGEHGIDILGRRVAKGSSPHTRGARDDVALSGGAGRIIPAYAGSTTEKPST